MKNAGMKKKPPKQIIQVMGLSEKEFAKEVKRAKKDKPSGRHCYLCGIHEGEEVIAVNVSGKEPSVCMPKTELYTIARKVGNYTFEYKLCFHCSLLLDAKREA